MESKMEKVRMGSTVFSRVKNEDGEWQKWQAYIFKSISLAKKANGLNSKTCQHRPQD